MYILEGNIGAGKSTFLTLLAQRIPHISVALEPVHEWQDTGYGQSLLTNFYKNPQRWAYTFENLTLISRVQNHLIEQQNKHPFRIIERSIYSGNYVFAHNSYENDFLNAIEWQMYQEWFHLLTHNKCLAPQGFIYLRVCPDIAFERIKHRNRSAESSITLSYLHQVHEKHERLLLQNNTDQNPLKGIPILTLNVNHEFESDQNVFAAHLESIMDFLKISAF